MRNLHGNGASQAGSRRRASRMTRPVEIPAEAGQTRHLAPSSPQDHGGIEAHPSGPHHGREVCSDQHPGPLVTGRSATRPPPEGNRSPCSGPHRLPSWLACCDVRRLRVVKRQAANITQRDLAGRDSWRLPAEFERLAAMLAVLAGVGRSSESGRTVTAPDHGPGAHAPRMAGAKCTMFTRVKSTVTPHVG